MCAMEVGDPVIRVQVIISASEVVYLQKRKYGHVAKSLQWGANTPCRRRLLLRGRGHWWAAAVLSER